MRVEHANSGWHETLNIRHHSVDRRSREALRSCTRDRPCEDFPFKSGEDYDAAVLLDLDYWVLIPR